MQKIEQERIFNFIQKFGSVSKNQLFQIAYKDEIEKMETNTKYRDQCMSSFNYYIESLRRQGYIYDKDKNVCLRTNKNPDKKIISALWVALNICEDIDNIEFVSLPFHLGLIRDNQYFQLATIEENSFASIPMLISSAKANESKQARKMNLYQYIIIVDSYELAAAVSEYDLPDTFQIALLDYGLDTDIPEIQYM